jgi:glycosyltransferase involved in cell wall biosynthesis
MRSLKILLFNWRCWLNPDMGGAEVFTREILTRWAEAGHDVTLFTAEFPGCRREEVLGGVKVVRSGRRFGVYGEAKKFYGKRFRAEGFDVVVDEINTHPFFAPKFVDNGEKVVGFIHQLAREYWFYEMPFLVSHIGYHFLEDRWLRCYVNVPTVTVSESTQQDLAELGFKRIFVVPEGLNFKPLGVFPEKLVRPVVVYAGRLKRAKRPDHAVKAFNIVKSKVPEAELWVLGDGPFRERLERLAGEGVRFFGWLPNEERRKLIADARVLVNPSVREGWGLNVIEANALGVPCVAYNVVGLRDSVKDEVTGLLVESGNVEALAEAIISILQDDAMRRQLGENALKYAKEFNWDKTAEEFMKILEQLTDED